MILDLRLPPGWTQRHLVVPGEPIEAGAGLAGALADAAVAALPPALADLTSGWLIVPPIEEAEDGSFGAGGPAALATLAAAALADRALAGGARERARLRGDERVAPPGRAIGAWEVTVLETTGQSRETGIESARLYAVLDAGYGAWHAGVYRL